MERRQAQAGRCTGQALRDPFDHGEIELQAVKRFAPIVASIFLIAANPVAWVTYPLLIACKHLYVRPR